MVDNQLDFDGTTFVAFSDLSGFKKMLAEDSGEAYKALNYMYNKAYELLTDNANVSAIAVSDCVVSWSRDNNLQHLVSFVSMLHKRMIAKRFLLKTTIAHGDFKYESRISLPNMQKGLILGNAYLKAYIANEKIKRPGRITLVSAEPTCNCWRWRKTRSRWEYFWSANSENQIRLIKSARNNARTPIYEGLKNIYAGIF